jgi:tetratricopeptide (TPR) repeat protein
MKKFSGHGWVLILFAILAVARPALSVQAKPGQQPPEYKELMSALRIEDLAARLKELERIKAAYPQSRYAAAIDNAILASRIGLAPDVDAVVKLQQPAIQSAQGTGRIFAYYSAAMQIVRHKNIAQFDKNKVTKTVEVYVAEGLKLASDPEFIDTIPPDQRDYARSNAPTLHLALALAYLNEGRAEKSQKSLQDYVKSGGVQEKTYHYVLGTTMGALGKNKEALDSFLRAAAEGFEDSAKKAKEYWSKVNGSSEGFEAGLEARQRQLPFQIERFEPAKEWKGKTVLAELFTGSECPPCVAADLGFDGLIESFGPEHLAALEYHLPIPRPDPIMNMATRRRGRFYGVNSTPAVFFDGESFAGGGGARQMAEEKYQQYAQAVKARVYNQAELRLKVSARLTGDDVRVRFSADKDLAGVECQFALVQEEEVYRGGNGIVYHKMVVRDFLTLDRAAAKDKTARFNIVQAEKDAEARLAEIEKERGFTFEEKHTRIDRARLLVVFFLQDSLTKKVYNAAVTKVE